MIKIRGGSAFCSKLLGEDSEINNDHLQRSKKIFPYSLPQNEKDVTPLYFCVYIPKFKNQLRDKWIPDRAD